MVEVLLNEVNVLVDVPEARFAIGCTIPVIGTCLCVGAAEDAGGDAELNAAFRDREVGERMTSEWVNLSQQRRLLDL